MKIYKMKDFSDKFSTDKKNIPSLPFRICAIGKTGSGKSGILGNILLRKDFYRDDFKPENIFIFSGSLQGDHKLKMMIEQLEIPDSNCFSEYDEDIGNTIYDMLVDNYNEKIDKKKPPQNSLIIFDDLGFSNLQNRNAQKNSFIDRLFSNGRKFLISTITLNQRITQLLTSARAQCSSLFLWSPTNHDLAIIEQDFNYVEKKKFIDMVRKNTKSRYDFLVIDFSKDYIYRNKDFDHLCLCDGDKNDCGGKKY
jgi:hypothetical protein